MPRIGFIVVVCLACLLGLARPAHAEVLQAPISGKAIPIGPGRIGCKPATGGWQLDALGLTVLPPADAEAVGQAVELKVATDAAGCATSSKTITLIATEHLPSIDPTATTLFVDDGRLELKGRGLQGLEVAWRNSSASGADVCHDPKGEGNQRKCSFSVGKSLSADPRTFTLSYVPVGGRSGSGVKTFDDDGHALVEGALELTPARIIVSRMLPDDAAIDLSTGQGEIPLAHPEAVSSVSCIGVSCAVSGGKLVVRGQSNLVSSVDVRFRLAPHAYLKKGDGAEAEPTIRLSVLHCPMSIASGKPVRGVDGARTIVKLEGRCAQDLADLHFYVGGEELSVVDSVTQKTAAWVVLQLGRFDATSLSITAVRGDLDEVPVAVARADTRAAPQPRTSIEIPGYPNLNFIPTNRPATVHVAPLTDGGHLVVKSVEGVYTANVQPASMTVQGDPYAAGLISLRLAYRVDGLPQALAETDLAIVSDPLQRSIGEANIPAPLDDPSASKKPLAEVLCNDGDGKAVPLPTGETAHLPYGVRDTCRLVVHRERLSPAYGTQKLSLEIDVLRSDGSVRTEAHVSQTFILKSGPEPRIAWIHGVGAPFDRIVIRLTHVADEAHYIGASELLTGGPALKWTAILGTGHVRLYATSAIPTGLYRFGDDDHTGVLSLNFGVISRLTWLDSEGHEGFLGLEGGVMVIGLAGSQSTTGQSLTQVGAVVGVGLSVPIANRSSPTEAAINLHAWYERDIGGAESDGRPWSIIFGPSISIGNVGLNL